VGPTRRRPAIEADAARRQLGDVLEREVDVALDHLENTKP
jgi:hypothetical protein